MTKRSKDPSHSDDVPRKAAPNSKGRAAGREPLESHGWIILMHPLFVRQLERLLDASENEAAKRAEGSLPGANEKLVAALTRLVFGDVPADPARKDFRQGDTLGEKRKHWFRAKFGNGRFRLFFRFRTDVRIIVFAWVNDAGTLRTYGSRTDAYAVFEKMLQSGNPPDDWDTLVATATSEAATRSSAALVDRLPR